MKNLMRSLLLLVLFSGIASAQLSFTVGAHGGLSISSFPKGIKDFYSSGFGGGLQGDVMFTRNLGVRLGADYRWFPSDKDKLKETAVAGAAAAGQTIRASLLDINGLNVSILGVTANAIVKVPVSKAVTPYAIAGVGIHGVRVGEMTLAYQGQTIPEAKLNADSESKVGFNGGIGTEFTMGVVGLYIEGKYVTILTETNNTNHFPITLGLFLNL